MRRLILAALLTIFALNASAQISGIQDFVLEPPEADTATLVQAYVAGTGPYTCGPAAPVVERSGSNITITFDPAPHGVCVPASAAWARHIDIGKLPVGTYNVTVVWNVAGVASTSKSAQLVVREAAQPFEVDPPVAPISGGNTVVVEVSNVASVTIGGAPAPIDTNSRLSFTPVIVPPHPAGPADVVVKFRDNTTATFTAFRYYDPNAAPDPSTFSKVLFPVFFNGPGAEGSQWVTDARMNLATGALLGSWRTITGSDTSGHTMLQVASQYSRTGGLFFFPARRQTNGIDYSLHIRDTSRSSQDFGTEVPVVFEGDTHSAFVLLNVPSDATSRRQLRVYDWDSSVTAVTMTIDSDLFRSPVKTVRVEMIPQCATLICDSPSFATVNLDQYLTEFGGARVRVAINPTGFNAGPSPRLWGMITVTNNDTQHVTVITPHRESRHLRTEGELQ